ISPNSYLPKSPMQNYRLHGERNSYDMFAAKWPDFFTPLATDERGNLLAPAARASPRRESEVSCQGSICTSVVKLREPPKNSLGCNCC
ncbi:MAG: hypothetical protein LIO91_11205, partial [Bacteroidales bacterium]|nr:hypothetical protein [Bacteroidales bacterium]